MSSGEQASSSSTRKLCPSKSTVYLGNISYSLTNNDLIQIVEHCGKVVCAKIAKHKESRKSKGYGFVQFLEPEAAHKCVEEYNGAQMFGRTWKCNIAIDNGRSAEFIRKREYPDKTRCYECGEFGHLSYKCTKNALGDREPPPKKKRKRTQKSNTGTAGENDSESEESSGTEDNETDSLSAAIDYQREKAEQELYQEAVSTGNYTLIPSDKNQPKRKFVKDEYFSDDESLVEAETDD